jgi:hypothetical protein
MANNSFQKTNNKQLGIITALVLVFGAIFLIMLTGLLGFIIFQHKTSLKKVAWNEALYVAEAGINYSRWHFLHAENDLSFSGNRSYAGIGEYELNILPPTGCSSGIKIESNGWTLDFPDLERKIKIKYSQPSLAKYSFLTNSNVWFGANEELKGLFHSNGGIRMDGDQNSLSTSAQETYVCGPEHGCSPSQEKEGIWGDGEGGEDGLWEFPVPFIDFDKITQDLGTLKTESKQGECSLTEDCYFEDSGAYGYHIEFLSNGSFNLYKVNSLREEVWGWNMEEWVFESNSIENETILGNFSVPSDCKPIFVEDNLWVNGDVNGRVVLAAAKLPDMPGQEPKIIIWGDISYIGADSVLGLIAQKDIIIPMGYPTDSTHKICSLENLEIKASLLAQKGRVFRYYYPDWSWQEPYKSCSITNYIETYGSIITNQMWTFTWVNSQEDVTSGYKETEMSYDPDLIYDPPPYFPAFGQYEIINWEEIY